MRVSDTRKTEIRAVSAVPAERDNEPDWASLVEAARGGKTAHVSALIEAAQPRLFRFCFYLCSDRARAEDLCQEALIKALENLKKLREPAQFLSWLLKSAKNLFIDHKRSAVNRESETLDDTPNADGSIATHGDRLRQEATQEEVVMVQDVLAQLDPDDRILLILVDMEERSYLEAAEIIGVSEAAVRSRLHRARKEFAEKFKGK